MRRNERFDVILRTLSDAGNVGVGRLAIRLNVSQMTIRRDLEALERRGQLRRVHGGAVPATARGYELPFEVRQGHRAEDKRRIGQAAAELLRTGEIVLLDTGTTTLEVARAMRDRHDLTVITPSLHIAGLLSEAPGVECISLGGRVRAAENATFGSLTLRGLAGFNADVCVIATGGISVDGGVTEYDPEAAAVTRAQMDRAQRVMVVADQHKLGQVTFAHVADVAAIDVLVTCADPDHAELVALERAGVTVVNVAAERDRGALPEFGGPPLGYGGTVDAVEDDPGRPE